MNKNIVIFILVVLIFIGGIWGSVADRKKMALKKQLSETVEQMEKLAKQNTIQREQVLGKTADLQGTLAEKEEQVARARKELVSLRKELKALESQLSACNASIQQITQEKNELASKMLVAKGEGGKKTVKEADSLQQLAEPDKQVVLSEKGQVDQYDEKSLLEQLQTAELTIEQLRQKFDAGNAQMMGLEKLLEEKNSAMEETSQDMDRLRINMDVLLSKIADQRDELQEVQEENRDLVKELAAKNEEVADLQEEIMRQPVQE